MEPVQRSQPGSEPAPEAHHLVRYLQHVRRELRRAVEGMAVADLERRVGGLNSVAWIVGHLAWQEQAYWLAARGEPEVAELEIFGHGHDRPQSLPAFEELFARWQRVTAATDPWLVGLSEAELRSHVSGRALFERENVGTLLTRVIGHYYLHIGQVTAIRKLLDYPVPGFVGSQAGAMYRYHVKGMRRPGGPSTGRGVVARPAAPRALPPTTGGGGGAGLGGGRRALAPCSQSGRALPRDGCPAPAAGPGRW